MIRFASEIFNPVLVTCFLQTEGSFSETVLPLPGRDDFRASAGIFMPIFTPISFNFPY